VKAGSPPGPELAIAGMVESPEARAPPSSFSLPPLSALSETAMHLPAQRIAMTTVTATSCRPAKTATWFSEALRARWEAYGRRLDECRDEPSAESVHELRVATRRLISQLGVVGCMVVSRKPDKAGRMLKRQLRSLGALRDVHVQRIFMERQSVRFPELVLLKEYLERREGELVRAAIRRTHSIKTTKLEKWVLNLMVALAEQENASSSRKGLSSAALRCAQDAFGQVVERRRLIDFSDLRTVHRTRVAFKKFRYVVESLPPDTTGLTKGALRSLAWYQRRMGSIQDLEVLQACVTDFLNRHEGGQHLLAEFCAYLSHRQTRALAAFRKSVDRLFELWPPAGVARSLQLPSRQFPA